MLSILSLFAYCLVGYLFGRRVDVNIQIFGKLLLYILTPSVVFLGTSRAESLGSVVLLPAIIVGIGVIISIAVYRVASRHLPPTFSHLAAYMSCAANSGYFGIPLAVSLYGERIFPYSVAATFGFILMENSLGIFYVARSSYSRRDSFYQIFKLPALYAFIFGIALNLSGFQLPHSLQTILENFRATYIVLGLMMVGIGLSKVRNLQYRRDFALWSLIPRHLIWPVMIGIVLWLFKSDLAVQERQVLLLMGMVPLPANAVIFSSLFGGSVELTSLNVVVSHLTSLFVIGVSQTFF